MLTAVIALSVLATQAPEREDRWADYTRSMSSRRLWGWSPASTSTDAGYLENEDDTKLLLRWGSQIEVSCRGAQTDDLVLFCFTMDGDFGYGNQPSMGAGFDCDDPCGYMDDSTGPSGVAGPMPCFVVQTNSTKYRRVARGMLSSWGGGVAPTYRTGRCIGVGPLVSGAPCDVDAECSPGTCVKDGIGAAGVFLSGQSTDSTLTCQIELGI